MTSTSTSSSLSTSQPSLQIPEASIRWFHACDVPKSDATPFRSSTTTAPDAAKPVKQPTNWLSFSNRDNALIENAWQDFLQKRDKKTEGGDSDQVSSDSVRVLVGEDQLFEVDVENKEIRPVAKQLEDGYRKFKPWSDGADSIEGSKPASYYKPEQKWALFGPWMNSYVVFTSRTSGWVLSDQLSSKVARVVMAQITRGENQGGTRVVRGWGDVEALLKKGKPKDKDKEKDKEKRRSLNSETTPVTLNADGTPNQSDTNLAADGKITADQLQKLQERHEMEDYNDTEDQERPINHLIFVIHGVLRHAIKDAARIQTASNAASKTTGKKSTIPDHGGIQVLPVQWRQKIEFGRKKKDQTSGDAKGKSGKDDGSDPPNFDWIASLEDITLEGVPSIRMLVSDVALDVLLYMTPKYRQEMIKAVTEEMNRIYATYIAKNPKFNGKVSIYGHSLGSLLAFDILCNQTSGDNKTEPAATVQSRRLFHKRGNNISEVDLSEVLRGVMSLEKQERRINGLMERTEMDYTNLNFSVDTLFAVGSPIGLFLLLKGDKLRARASGNAFEIGISRPAVNAMYNIFHPHDPVAYRCEPLVSKKYSGEKPVQIQYTKGGLRSTFTGIADLSSDLVDRGRNIFSGIFSTTSAVVNGAGHLVGLAGFGKSSSASAPTSVTNSTSDVSAAAVVGLQNFGVNTSQTGTASTSPVKPPNEEEAAQKGQTTNTTATPSVTIPSVTDEAGEAEVALLNSRGRIDYVLQEGVLENPYLSSLSSHMTYWPDQDVAAFILKELWKDDKGESSP
ncbi:hypothetical protein HDU76_008890 [Blyttiomyces sp. JEL0837]|nr:hypothetical protein HDU76_008890 [Blyttiomyces sp. JEL0837]